MTGEKIRTFIAIKLAPEIISSITRVQEKLRGTGGRVKWVEPSNIHITLKFLGNITPEQLDKVIFSTREALRPFKPFDVSVSGLGAFPRAASPRVIWVGVKEGKEKLTRLSKAIDDSLSRIGFPPERRQFSPHLTLGRVKSPQGIGGLTQAITSTDASNLGNMLVAKIAIMRSQLTPAGPIYTALEEIELIAKRILHFANRKSKNDKR